MASKVANTARWMLVCATCVGGFEGLWLTAKPDNLAYGIPTVCYGETEGVHLGDTYSKDECLDMLAHKLPRYWAEIEKCIHTPVSDNEKIADTSLAYNIGSAAFCRSSVAHKLNAGDHIGACNAFMNWTHAGGKEVQGLKNRRAKERIICLTPDPAPVYVPKTPDADFCSGSGQGLDCPRNNPPKTPPKPLVCHGWWFWKHCS